ncbi:hypothetical protein MAFF212519_09830 [Clavibacter michiganensis]
MGGGELVAVGIHLDAEVLEAGEAATAQQRVVLADARREDHRVEAAELGRVGADVAADPVPVDLERERARGSPSSSAACTSRMSPDPVSPSSPLPRLRSVSSSSKPRPAWRCRWKSTAGSMSPERVPITRPSSGVMPIDVSIERPPSTAHAEAPLPMCSTIMRVSSSGFPRNAAAAHETNRCEVPWKP